ncbi:MAG: nucleotidyltransferase domain-containing protein [Candidatus Delongbacteria bacterium]|jgi:pyruvate,water dikinase|nr:nucleotidyltransferase domain-containing protein [Candidatus Delongbacteria bacterium]
MKNDKLLSKLINDLNERAKESKCLYEIQNILNDKDIPFEEVCYNIVTIIPMGWQFPEICKAQLLFKNKIFQIEDYKETPWTQETQIVVQGKVVGQINVFYTEERPQADIGPFLKEELDLIKTIGKQFELYVLHQNLRSVFDNSSNTQDANQSEWRYILDLLTRTDKGFAVKITRKMINFLCLHGVKEAESLLDKFGIPDEGDKEKNFPFKVSDDLDSMMTLADVFSVAERHLNENEILTNVHKWIKQESSAFMANILNNNATTVSEIISTLEKYHFLAEQGLKLSSLRQKSFTVALIRKFMTEQRPFIDVAKKHLDVDSFYKLTNTLIHPEHSLGKLGGKSSGLIVASHILLDAAKKESSLSNIKTPKTWYVTADGILDFMKYNNLEDIMEQKYKDIGLVRQEYPYVIHVFKNSPFSSEMIKELSKALDDLGDTPLVVRSSSLLEDRMGTAFAGKYKSLFVANQGSKKKRLTDLMDAIAEVYASTFGPDPIQYRIEHGLLDYNEQMGIMIQEVVGKKVGDYFFPAFAGVAFSNNEYRWSSRIKREDGLIRFVPGLGTRAVDRTSDDYPILISPGNPDLRVNVSIDETIRYSPKCIDLINLKTKKFETKSINELIKECGSEYPIINKLVSIISDKYLHPPRKFGTDYKNDNFVFTFDGLLSDQNFIKEINMILRTLKQQYEHPVDIEFAHDGDNLYLLQCRPQNLGYESKPIKFPDAINPEDIIFTANKYVSNGLVQGVSHVVYVDPIEYSNISSLDELKNVGKAVGLLNKILPKRQFILMGPGRWGSRGDIKLGVSVSYSDINNSSMLIEIARKNKNYVPDLSFGTHFFLDLVEAGISYLPLFPDNNEIIFNEAFFTENENVFTNFIPQYSSLANVIKVIDVNNIMKGKEIQIFMNSESDKAIALIRDVSDHFSEIGLNKIEVLGKKSKIDIHDECHWKWRLRAVEKIAKTLDPVKFGVKEFYIFGSAKNATSKPDSDIDILIHFNGSEKQKESLLTWLDAWSISLGYYNFLNTGYKIENILDIHIITDQDIVDKNSYAMKISAISDSARPLLIKKK